jgi:hypothetical protein
MFAVSLSPRWFLRYTDSEARFLLRAGSQDGGALFNIEDAQRCAAENPVDRRCRHLAELTKAVAAEVDLHDAAAATRPSAHGLQMRS